MLFIYIVIKLSKSNKKISQFFISAIFLKLIFNSHSRLKHRNGT